MSSESFQALVVESVEGSLDSSTESSKSTRASVKRLTTEQLPSADVTIRVSYSSLNYKDALAYQGHKGVVKRLPHIPGIDAAGTVVESNNATYQCGDEVVVTGYDLGQGHWGGWSELIRVPSEWIVPLPAGLTLREAMIWGTAGFTAAQSVMALERNDVFPGSGEVVVTGASGGVGSLAVRILAQLGYEVVAVTGKEDQHEALLGCGARRVISRQELTADSKRPLLSATWGGAIDTVGGDMLTTLLRSTKYGGCVTACGLVAGADLSMTVYPFLLRGVSLCGIASADCPYEKRLKIWQLLAGAWKPNNLLSMLAEIELAQLPDSIERILLGKIAGRVLVKL